MPFPSQQSGYSIPLMVGHVMNESTKPHRGIKGSVKDCGYTHEHTDGRLTKLGNGRRKWQQFSQSELLIQAIFSTGFASCTVCILILLDFISYTLIQILTHSQAHSTHMPLLLNIFLFLQFLLDFQTRNFLFFITHDVLIYTNSILQSINFTNVQ